MFVLFTGIITGSTSAYAYAILYDGGYSPLTASITCYSGFMAETKTAVHNACLQWNGAGAGDLVFRTTFDHSNTIFPLENAKNQITSGTRGSNNYVMRTSVIAKTNFLTDYIVEADIDINTSYPWANNGSPTSFDVGDCITHEIGHLLGLDHSTVTGATMKEPAAPGQTSRRTIEQDDKNGINAIY